jgi:hypothetical protein
LKKLWIALLFSVLLCGCNAANQSSPPTPAPAPAPTLTPMLGTWQFQMKETDNLGVAKGNFSATMISSGCPVIMQGQVCFTSSEQGIAGGFTPGPGEWEYSAAFFLDLGVASTNSNFEVSSGSIMAFYLAECDDGAEDCVAFTGTGTITNGTATGTWECYTQDDTGAGNCETASGTFSGTTQ